MLAGMTTKIAVSLPDALVRNARKSVRSGREKSVSGYIARAMEDRAKNDDLAALLEEMLEETGGPPTADERRQARRDMGLDRPRARSRRTR